MNEAFEAWLRAGIEQGFCSAPLCFSHGGLPATEEEEAALEDGYDPCIPIVRLWGDTEIKEDSEFQRERIT